MMQVPHIKTTRNPVTGLWERELYQPEKNIFLEETPAAEWPIGRTVPEITTENAASITPEQWTAAQDAAIARGDMVEAQRLRDLHFQFVSGINPKIVYRGGKSNPREGTIVKYQNDDPVKHPTPYVFKHSDLTPEPYRNLSADRGIYFTDNEPYALKFTRTIRGTEAIFNPQHVGSYYLNIKSPYKAAPDTEPIGFSTVKNIYSKPDFHSKYDGIIGKDIGFINDSGNVYVVRSSNQAKLSDAVTYDDAGNIIPLSKRDNFNINDVRYSLLPFGIGLTGYGLFNNQEALGGNLSVGAGKDAYDYRQYQDNKHLNGEPLINMF